MKQRKHLVILFSFLICLSANLEAQRCVTSGVEHYQLPAAYTQIDAGATLREQVQIPLSLHFVRGAETAFSVDMTVVER
ncbi:MAG: hypothetical protein AAFO94_13170, partial [Bacteroidota bacterium]